MGEFTNNIKKRADKLNKLVVELEKIDRFRSIAKGRDEKIDILIRENGPYASSAEIALNDFKGLAENVQGLIEVAFNKRYEEIHQILRDEYGGAYVEVDRVEVVEEEDPYVGPF